MGYAGSGRWRKRGPRPSRLAEPTRRRAQPWARWSVPRSGPPSAPPRVVRLSAPPSARRLVSSAGQPLGWAMRMAPASRCRAATTSGTCSACTPRAIRFRSLSPGSPCRRRLRPRRLPYRQGCRRRPPDGRRRHRLGPRISCCRHRVRRLRFGRYQTRSSAAARGLRPMPEERSLLEAPPMMRKLFGLALVVALSVALTATASASRGHGGGFHGGSHQGFHHHGFHHCCFTTAFFGGVFVAAPLAYPFYAYPYYYPYPDMYPTYPPVYQEAPPIQRDVCYVGGCYHLEGDGVTVAYRWIWIPNPPEPPPAPPPQ